MAEWVEFTAKTVDEAITDASIKLGTTSDKIEYEVVEKESSGFIGLFSKPAKIKVKVKDEPYSMVEDFLNKVFTAMNIDFNLKVSYDEEEKQISVEVSGEDMGILIGKRGQTLDSLQYLSSLVANKDSKDYIKVKIDRSEERREGKSVA